MACTAALVSVAELDQRAHLFRLDRQLGLLDVDVVVEGAAEHDVAGDLAEDRRLHFEVALIDESRHIGKAHAADLAAIPLDPGFDEAGRRVEADPGFRRAALDEVQLHQHLAERDDAVPAHVAIAFVVDEDHAEIGLVGHRRQQVGAVHVGVAARLVHQELAQIVALGLQPGALVEDGGARHRRHAGGDDAQGFAAGVGVDGVDGAGQVEHGDSQCETLRATAAGTAAVIRNYTYEQFATHGQPPAA